MTTRLASWLLTLAVTVSASVLVLSQAVVVPTGGGGGGGASPGGSDGDVQVKDGSALAGSSGVTTDAGDGVSISSYGFGAAMNNPTGSPATLWLHDVDQAPWNLLVTTATGLSTTMWIDNATEAMYFDMNGPTLSSGFSLDASTGTGASSFYAGNYSFDVTVAGAYALNGLTTNGVVTTTGGTGVLSVDATITAGQWTPTLTNVANLDGSTAFQCQYSRIGATVTGSCRVSADPMAAATSTQLGISLPVASNFGAVEDAAGSCAAEAIAMQSAAIRADAANDRLEMRWVAGDVTDQPMTCAFSYQVI